MSRDHPSTKIITSCQSQRKDGGLVHPTFRFSFSALLLARQDVRVPRIYHGHHRAVEELPARRPELGVVPRVVVHGGLGEHGEVLHLRLAKGGAVGGDEEELGAARPEALEALLVPQDGPAGLHDQLEPGVHGLHVLLLRGREEVRCSKAGVRLGHSPREELGRSECEAEGGSPGDVGRPSLSRRAVVRREGGASGPSTATTAISGGQSETGAPSGVVHSLLSFRAPSCRWCRGWGWEGKVVLVECVEPVVVVADGGWHRRVPGGHGWRVAPAPCCCKMSKHEGLSINFVGV